MKNYELHLQAEIDRLKKENQIIKKLATTAGFFQYYFENLKNYKTNIECFNIVNEIYYNHFKEYKYSSYSSFKNQIKINLKK